MVKAGFVSDNEIIEPAKANIFPISPQKRTNYEEEASGLSITSISHDIFSSIKETLEESIRNVTKDNPITCYEKNNNQGLSDEADVVKLPKWRYATNGNAE